MDEILRLIGYGFFAAAILVILYETLLFYIEQEEGE